MPSATAATNAVIMQHNSASDFLALSYPTLRRHEASSNIIFAHALKRVNTEAALTEFQFTSDADVEACISTADESSFIPHPTSGAFWLTVWSQPSIHARPQLDMVLSCVDWTLGNYPIFLWTPKRQDELSQSWLNPRINQLVEYLRICVPSERVFSVFGMTPLVKAFTRQWSQLTGHKVEPEPFYSAYFSFCNSKTFKPSNLPLPEGHRLRRAEGADLEQVAQLCKEFADDSVYFPLSLDRARIEARELIQKRIIWVYDLDGAITTICAVTRNTHRVSAITKVYTTPMWRRRGCAEFLVRHVTAQLLFDCCKESVVLYVGHKNSAQKVYHRVGFPGLCGEPRVEGVEDSIELGLQNTARGQW
ncbi:hypothetical protein BDY19DRAFT_21113 [Irpex rosettiformis]|uniref:Uncharacterized protein n=1 Tax=Irpex rosettiformis TaxID=378272 RepID=A0ACB8UJB0_9APHY|nr:hypothetical protein BDY19DRAFT_21113 [Irpex rosettiformis]